MSEKIHRWNVEHLSHPLQRGSADWLGTRFKAFKVFYAHAQTSGKILSPDAKSEAACPDTCPDERIDGIRRH